MPVAEDLEVDLPQVRRGARSAELRVKFEPAVVISIDTRSQK
jgi:hypothetical protein